MTPLDRAVQALQEARDAALDWANTDRTSEARAALADVDAAIGKAAGR